MAGKILAQLSALLSLDTKGFEAGIGKAKKQSSLLNTAFKSVGAAVAGAFTIGAIANFTAEAVKLSSEAEGVRNAFKKLNESAQ